MQEFLLKLCGINFFVLVVVVFVVLDIYYNIEKESLGDCFKIVCSSG